MVAQDVVTSTYYMDRDDKFLTEKPYEVKFPPPEGFPATNTSWSEYNDIRVKDIRGQEEKFTVESAGFQIAKFVTSLSPSDFRDAHKVEEVFLKEAGQCLKEILGAERVLVFDYNLRISVPGFPISDGKPIEHQTPATIVHIDTTSAWTKHMNSLYEDTLDSMKQQRRYQYVNLWKPIKGPVKRWPLMLCDWNTYDAQKDVIARDLVYTDGQLETYVGMYSPKHKYHYLSDQLEDEAWIMVQSDSRHDKGVLHTAFPSPLTTGSDSERESIEVRCMVYYEDGNA